MTLSDEQIRVIEKYPLKDLLNRFPAKLCDLESSNDSWRSDIASLLFAILDSATALNLPAPNGDGNVADKLFAIRQKIRLGALQLIQFQPLVDAVVASSPDRNIWAAVFSLIADLKPSTPPPSSIPPTSEQQIKIISECPLKNRLDHLRDKLRDNVDNPQEEDIADLLGVLVGSPAAFSLPSPDGNGDVAGKLFLVHRNVRRGAVRHDEFCPLIRHVVANSPDLDIWAAVFTLIADLKPSTPPPSSISPTFGGTPIKSSSSRLADSETCDIVEGELFEEIKNCTFRNVGGFWDKFFDSKCWRQEQKTMLEGILTTHDGKRWTGFPSVPDEKPVWDWLRFLEERFLVDAPYKFHTTRTANQFKERKGQMDLFLQRPAAEESNIFWYKHVLVVGEQKKSYDTSKFKADFLQVTRYVRSVFADQPTRRFAHAFSLCASKMELWVFDRSGAYSSGTFDIHDEPDKLARALVGYLATMDDDLMGLDTFVERQEGHRYVTLVDASDKETRLRLDKAMVRQKAIVCRGTTCYETQDSHVAKFSWASDKRKLEVEQLKLAEAMGVEGVARVVVHRRIANR